MQSDLTQYLRRRAADFAKYAAEARSRGDFWYAEKLGHLAAAYEEHACAIGEDERPPRGAAIGDRRS